MAVFVSILGVLGAVIGLTSVVAAAACASNHCGKLSPAFSTHHQPAEGSGASEERSPRVCFASERLTLRPGVRLSRRTPSSVDNALKT